MTKLALILLMLPTSALAESRFLQRVEPWSVYLELDKQGTATDCGVVASNDEGQWLTVILDRRFREPLISIHDPNWRFGYAIHYTNVNTRIDGQSAPQRVQLRSNSLAFAPENLNQNLRMLGQLQQSKTIALEGVPGEVMATFTLENMLGAVQGLRECEQIYLGPDLANPVQ